MPQQQLFVLNSPFAIEMAKSLASSNPEALARIKRVVWAGIDEWPRLLEERAAMSGTLVLSDYTRNAIAAFAKRG